MLGGESQGPLRKIRKIKLFGLEPSAPFSKGNLFRFGPLPHSFMTDRTELLADIARNLAYINWQFVFTATIQSLVTFDCLVDGLFFFGGNMRAFCCIAIF